MVVALEAVMATVMASTGALERTYKCSPGAVAALHVRLGSRIQVSCRQNVICDGRTCP